MATQKTNYYLRPFLVAGVIIALVVSFGLGMLVGQTRMIRRTGFVSRQFGHGVVGTVQSIGANSFVVADRFGGWKTIETDATTVFRHDHSLATYANLATGSSVLVIGEPKETEGAIRALVVRIL